MVCSNSVDELSNEYCQYDDRCGQAATNRCQTCEQSFCIDHYLKHQKKIQEHFEYVLRRHGSLNQKLKSLISKLSADDIFDLIEQIYEFKIKSNEIEKTANLIQQHLQDPINEDKQQLNKIVTNGSESDRNGDLDSDIECLRKDIRQLKLKLEEIESYSQKSVSQEPPSIPDINIQSDDASEATESPLPDAISSNENNHLRSDTSITGTSVVQKTDDNSVLSHLLLRQMSPSIIDLNESELDLTDATNETFLGAEEEEEEKAEEIIAVNSADTTPRINQKIRLANNIVSLMRGPFKVMVDGTMHAVEVFAKEGHATDALVQAVKKGLARQKQTTNNSFKPAFAKITSKWIYEGENPDQGFSSASIWMRNPHGQRILVKIQDLPLCAANEWLAYVLGRQIGLPVNKVQIAIYEKNLVTLHNDVGHENEKTITFMELPAQLRKVLLTDPIMARMDLFDRVIQNVDRNPRNILLTIPNTADIDDAAAKFKIHLIDHGSCFGMGKLNGISVMASKLHTKHLSVVKFNPVGQARKFDRYLSKLPTADRILMRKTLNRFAAITNDQIDSWLTEVQDFLTPSQYNRIHDVLHRQRDIARRYAIQWGIYPRSSNEKSIESSELLSETDDTMTYF